MTQVLLCIVFLDCILDTHKYEPNPFLCSNRFMLDEMFLRNSSKYYVASNKNMWVFCIPKVWQILKSLGRTFHQE